VRIAIIHDWLVSTGGAERCLEVFCELFPQADIYSLVYNPENIDSKIINSMKITTSFIQRMPFGVEKYRNYLPLMPKAVESFKLTGYDLVISSSHCAAKGVKVSGNTCHICYCYTPMRYVWDMYNVYFKGTETGLAARLLMPLFVNYLRRWDVKSAERVDYFIAISENIRKKIKKYYNREANVIYPPVNMEYFHISKQKREDFFLVVSRLVPYKRIDLAVRVFNELKLPLVIIGDGPCYKKLSKLAGSNIKLIGKRTDEELRDYYSRARALVFTANEDFGIVPLEAQACGCPVIAYGEGGALETVKEGVTGKYFYPQTEDALAAAIKGFKSDMYKTADSRKHSLEFDRNRFKNKVKDFILIKYELFFRGKYA